MSVKKKVLNPYFSRSLLLILLSNQIFYALSSLLFLSSFILIIFYQPITEYKNHQNQRNWLQSIEWAKIENPLIKGIPLLYREIDSQDDQWLYVNLNDTNRWQLIQTESGYEFAPATLKNSNLSLSLTNDFIKVSFLDESFNYPLQQLPYRKEPNSLCDFNCTHLNPFFSQLSPESTNRSILFSFYSASLKIKYDYLLENEKNKIILYFYKEDMDNLVCRDTYTEKEIYFALEVDLLTKSVKWFSPDYFAPIFYTLNFDRYHTNEISFDILGLKNQKEIIAKLQDQSILLKEGALFFIGTNGKITHIENEKKEYLFIKKIFYFNNYIDIHLHSGPIWGSDKEHLFTFLLDPVSLTYFREHPPLN